MPVAGEAATELPDAGGGEGVAGVEEEGSAPGLLLEGCKEALSFIPAGFGLRGYCYSLVWGGGGRAKRGDVAMIQPGGRRCCTCSCCSLVRPSAAKHIDESISIASA